jgi:ABC-type anion transport system duplicated permease subunit
MRHLFSIGPWLADLVNPPPRDSLTLSQKAGRVLLVTVTLVTLCVIAALLMSLGFFAWQRSREVLLGIPQLVNVLKILAASIVVNVVCVTMLFQIKKVDRKLVPRPDVEIEVPLPPREDTAGTAKR